jgi:hypothetical protein
MRSPDTLGQRSPGGVPKLDQAGQQGVRGVASDGAGDGVEHFGQGVESRACLQLCSPAAIGCRNVLDAKGGEDVVTGDDAAAAELEHRAGKLFDAGELVALGAA